MTSLSVFAKKDFCQLFAQKRKIIVKKMKEKKDYEKVKKVSLKRRKCFGELVY